jgi:hypothetical protein
MAGKPCESLLGLFRGDGLSRLLDTDLPNLLKIGNPKKYLSDPFLSYVTNILLNNQWILI